MTLDWSLQELLKGKVYSGVARDGDTQGWVQMVSPPSTAKLLKRPSEAREATAGGLGAL